MAKNIREEFSKYEIARILGARTLQLAMDAPILVKISKEELERLKYDPLKIAEIEFNSDALPISVKRPFPSRREAKLKKEAEEKKAEKEDKEIIEKELKEEKEIKEEGEIMELAQPEDEVEHEEEEEEGVEE